MESGTFELQKSYTPDWDWSSKIPTRVDTFPIADPPQKLQLSDLAANRAVMVRLIIYPDLSAKAPPSTEFGRRRRGLWSSLISTETSLVEGVLSSHVSQHE